MIYHKRLLAGYIRWLRRFPQPELRLVMLLEAGK